jgi:DNA (cytosine-5)-methyltransferase 1
MRRRPQVVSVFSGCGGLDLGFERAGFETRVMVEVSSFACETLRTNFGHARVMGPPDGTGDVRDVDVELGLPGVDVLIGGPPCQSFSIAAAQRFLKGDAKFKRTGFRDKARGNLIYEYLRILEELRPRVFVIENVPGLQRIDGGVTLREIVGVCRSLGYKMAEPTILQAADYGVPQLRQRLVVMGALEAVPALPKPTHSRIPGLFALPYRCVAEALYAFPEEAENHAPRAHLPSSIRRYRRLKVGQREHLGRVDRLDPRKPSKTVIAGGSNGGGRSHLHPYLARTLTVRECARLQTFPDSFVLRGTMSRQFTQVGNAVPPLLAEELARAIGQQFFDMAFEGPATLRLPRDRPTVEKCVSWLVKQARRDVQLRYDDVVTNGSGRLNGHGTTAPTRRVRSAQRRAASGKRG